MIDCPMPTRQDARSYLVLYATRLLGRPYMWGGESEAEGGDDCSGFVHEVLVALARHWPDLYDGERRSAAGLFGYFVNRGVATKGRVPDLVPGMAVFWHKQDAIVHVRLHLATLPPMTAVGDHDLLPVGPVGIESSGGGPDVTSPRAALKATAGVRFCATDTYRGGTAWVALDFLSLIP